VIQLPRIHKRLAPAVYLGWLGIAVFYIQQFYLGWLVGTVYPIQESYLGWLGSTALYNPTEIRKRFPMVFSYLYKGYS